MNRLCCTSRIKTNYLIIPAARRPVAIMQGKSINIHRKEKGEKFTLHSYFSLTFAVSLSIIFYYFSFLYEKKFFTYSYSYAFKKSFNFLFSLNFFFVYLLTFVYAFNANFNRFDYSSLHLIIFMCTELWRFDRCEYAQILQRNIKRDYD